MNKYQFFLKDLAIQSKPSYSPSPVNAQHP